MRRRVVYFMYSLIVVTGLGCESEDVKPQIEKRLISYETTDQTKALRATFAYDAEGKLTELSWTREVPHQTTGSDKYSYDSEGKATQLIRSMTGLHDEKVVYTFGDGQIFVSEHFSNNVRFAYIYYTFDAKGMLIRTEQLDLVPSGIGYLRGKEMEFNYNDDGNLSEVKTYSFVESSATLALQSVETYSAFLDHPNPLQPFDVLPNYVFQKKLPTQHTISTGGVTKMSSYQYTFDADRYPVKSLHISDGKTETTTYHYEQ